MFIPWVFGGSLKNFERHFLFPGELGESHLAVLEAAFRVRGTLQWWGLN